MLNFWKRPEPEPEPRYRIDKVGGKYVACVRDGPTWWMIDHNHKRGHTRSGYDNTMFQDRYTCATEQEAGERINAYAMKYESKTIWEG